MAEIERELVKKSFGKHAGEYDALAKVQKKVTDRLAALLTGSIHPPATLLDIGAGTGRLLEKISREFPDSALVGVDLAFRMTEIARNRLEHVKRAALVCGDAEKLPFQDNSFDIVVSTSTYQWIAPLKNAFAETQRVLKPSGRFIFALFAEKTLCELKESYRQAALEAGRKGEERTHRFATVAEVLADLTGAGFSGCRLDDEMELEIHPDVATLLRSLKEIGAGSAARNGGGLSGRSTMLRMMEIYQENYAVDGGVPASYHVVYGYGEKR